ncbi:MAG: hypothetical protein R3C62_16865 [Chloroflexota bacterium]
MTFAQPYTIPKLRKLPNSMPADGSMTVVLEEGIPIFRAATAVQHRIESLLDKQKTVGLTGEENDELDEYEMLDDYLSYLNRLVRNLRQADDAAV